MTTPAKHRGISLTALLFGVVLIVGVGLASVLDSPELGTAVGTVGLALGTLWLAAGARDQATLARQALDAQTQPFLTAVDDPDPAGLAGEAMPAQSGHEGESVRWRLGVINAGHGTCVISEVKLLDLGNNEFPWASVERSVLRPGDWTYASVRSGIQEPEGSGYRFELAYADIQAGLRLRGAVRLEVSYDYTGLRGWVTRISWTDTLSGLDQPRLVQDLAKPIWDGDDPRGSRIGV